MTNMDSLVVEAFRGKAVRSVMLVDECFPTFSELVSAFLSTTVRHENATPKIDPLVDDVVPAKSIGSAQSSSDQSAEAEDLLRRFREAPLASELYSAFHSSEFLCDVANKEADWKDTLSARIANSDLVVLDLHLNGASDDSSDSIKILRSLAQSRKFNLVIVYTKAPDLQVSAKMVGGSLLTKRSVENDSLEVEMPEILNKLYELEAPRNELVDWYLTGKEVDKGKIKLFMHNVFQKYKNVACYKQQIKERVAEHYLVKEFSVDWNLVNVPVISADTNATNPWLLYENVFVCFARKYDPTTKVGTKPTELIPLVDQSIVSWNPGLPRVILSQIRNTIGRRGLEFLSGIPDDIETQISWLWNSTIHESNSEEGTAALETLIKTLLVSFTDQVVSDEELGKFVHNVLALIPRSNLARSQLETVSQSKWYGREGIEDIKEVDVLHALNVFQSTKRFSRNHITTGTIMRRVSANSFPMWLVCVEPACDTVPSQAPKSEEFLHCRMLELFRSDAQTAVREAHNANYLFVKCLDGAREYLSIKTNRGLPKLLTTFVCKSNQIRNDLGKHIVAVRFTTLGAEPTFISVDYEVVSQLHDAYANRLLHETGHHLSRVGLDFVSLADKSEKNEAQGGSE